MQSKWRFVFSLKWLFVLVTIFAIGTCLYTRAERRVQTCADLYKMHCPVAFSSALPPTEYKTFLMLHELTSRPANAVTWRGIVPAVCGVGEFDRFTIFVNPRELAFGESAERRILELVAGLDGAEIVVIGAGHNPDILSNPPVARFVMAMRQKRPNIRIIVEQFTIVG